MSNVRKIETSEFDREVLGADTPVLVDFYADWCGPCRAMAPVVETLAEKADGRYQVVKVNVDEERDLAARYEIRSIPTFLVFRNGETAFRHMGLAQKGTLTSALDEAAVLAAK
ncbi:MAG: thioredoxin [bacterium]